MYDKTVVPVGLEQALAVTVTLGHHNITVALSSFNRITDDSVKPVNMTYRSNSLYEK